VRFKASDVENPATRKGWLRPEHEDVARISRETGMDYEDVLSRLI
jgi:hypothetical protein